MTSKLREIRNQFKFRLGIFCLSCLVSIGLGLYAIAGDMATAAVVIFALMATGLLDQDQNQNINKILNLALGEFVGITIGAVMATKFLDSSLFRNDILTVYEAFLLSFVIVVVFYATTPRIKTENSTG